MAENLRGADRLKKNSVVAVLGESISRMVEALRVGGQNTETDWHAVGVLACQ